MKLQIYEKKNELQEESATAAQQLRRFFQKPEKAYIIFVRKILFF